MSLSKVNPAAADKPAPLRSILSRFFNDFLCFLNLFVILSSFNFKSCLVGRQLRQIIKSPLTFLKRKDLAVTTPLTLSDKSPTCGLASNNSQDDLFPIHFHPDRLRKWIYGPWFLPLSHPCQRYTSIFLKTLVQRFKISSQKINCLPILPHHIHNSCMRDVLFHQPLPLQLNESLRLVLSNNEIHYKTLMSFFEF